MADSQRHFLFLQGPHGPFFDQLAERLRQTGARTTRVGFNAGDQFFWRNPQSFIAFQEPLENWADALKALIKDHGITDLVLYGDTRPIHRIAIDIAKAYGLPIHVFEEGYLRPFWATYERTGSNGHSRLMGFSVSDMENMLGGSTAVPPGAPDHWGDLREHIFYGALYHWFVLFKNRQFANFKSHREISVNDEFNLYIKRLIKMPLHRVERFRATRRIKHGGFPYHLVLLQLAHDESFRSHSKFTSLAEFLNMTIQEFARGAPRHHHLVFKAHPLEDGRTPLARDIRRLTQDHHLKGRVHFVQGGKLAGLLDGAKTALTINSTAAQQALWRGLPLKVYGQAVYQKPEFVSPQPLAEFFANPTPPDSKAYRVYRRFLLATSQVPGGYYAGKSRRQLMRHLVDMMLRPHDPYDTLILQKAAGTQQLKLVIPAR